MVKSYNIALNVYNKTIMKKELKLFLYRKWSKKFTLKNFSSSDYKFLLEDDLAKKIRIDNEKKFFKLDLYERNEIIKKCQLLKSLKRNEANHEIDIVLANIYFLFNEFSIKEVKDNCLLAIVVRGGRVGSNKAADTDANIKLNAITSKDKKAFNIGLDLGIKNYSLSFTNSAKDVSEVREIIGNNVNLISKIESVKGVLNLGEILPVVDQILIDRGDLSREVSIEKIPFVQRRIISYARSKDTPVFVATNLLESMINSTSPTRAEANDVASTLLMGASGLVLAAETAIGKYPVVSVEMIQLIIKQYSRWTTESSFNEIIFQDD